MVTLWFLFSIPFFIFLKFGQKVFNGYLWFILVYLGVHHF
jgi:hypothetical protein